jgi:hypothetical protein
MTWLGKIFTFVVMIGVIVWAYFTVQLYVTRVNWKAELDRERVARRDADSALKAESRRHQAGEDALNRLLKAERIKNEDLATQVKSLSDAAGKIADDYKRLQLAMSDFNDKTVARQATVDKTIKELDSVRDRKDFLENVRVALEIENESAKKDKVRAENAAKLASAIAEDYARKAEELQARVTELKATGGGSGTATVLRTLDKPPPPLLENARGEVKNTAGDLVTVSIGIDAGLAVGTVMDIYRTEGGGRYLGTVKVTSALNLYPKEAIMIFTPAGKRPIDNLKPEELPRKGDVVRPPSALTGGGQ